MDVVWMLLSDPITIISLVSVVVFGSWTFYLERKMREDSRRAKTDLDNALENHLSQYITDAIVRQERLRKKHRNPET